VDVWEASDGTPIVYHGFTLTSKVSFADCIEAICESAFITSDLPIILSLEVHCKDKGQKIMATILKNVLNDPKYSTLLSTPTNQATSFWHLSKFFRLVFNFIQNNGTLKLAKKRTLCGKNPNGVWEKPKKY